MINTKIKIDIMVRSAPGKDFISGDEFVNNLLSYEYKSTDYKNESLFY